MAIQKNDQATRRFLLKLGTASLVVAAGVGVASTASAKVPQKGVQYVAVSTKPKMKCSNCANFVKPNACKTVDGVISPEGYCMIWAPAPK
jgi:hypothetical protein